MIVRFRGKFGRIEDLGIEGDHMMLRCFCPLVHVRARVRVSMCESI